MSQGVSEDTVVRVLIKDRAKLFAYVWSIVRDEHVAEDTLQDVSVLVLRKRNDIKDEQHLLAWMRIAARNKALLALRHMRNKPQSLDDSILRMLEEQWAEHDHNSPSDDLDALKRCMDQLTPRARELIRLRYSEGFSGKELSTKVEQTVKSVYVAISRIHRSLGDCLERSRRKGASFG